MLNMRLGGDPDEARAFLNALRATGVEVGPTDSRSRDGFKHVYTTIRMPGYADTAPTEPIRVKATTPAARRALPRGRSRR